MIKQCSNIIQHPPTAAQVELVTQHHLWRGFQRTPQLNLIALGPAAATSSAQLLATSLLENKTLPLCVLLGD
jgi:hypothetical protein